ncbi:MAG TPA: phytoene/squalene synthase family protein [Gemmatimonadaceae bacterium]|nr:phytoene/squalene synthase family protein [Gemmatimonadaceae bacterium]
MTIDGGALQDRLLPGVSRTFALTIPQLPPALRPVVTNAYLLCRIADTIEDEVALSADEKLRFSEWFIDVVAGRRPATTFADALEPLLTASTSDDERELIRETPGVIRVTASFEPRQRDALERCIRIMCDGMPRFQRNANLSGLADVPELDTYCYYVAGVVGEMLTELFCSYSPEIEAQRERLAPLAVSFGLALQMTNIIKDIWDDRRRGVSWMPRDIFTFPVEPGDPRLAESIDEIIGIAHAHLRDALAYTLIIPAHETGIRRFLLWALGLAILTLRKLSRNPDFLAGKNVKVSRRTVRATVFVTSLCVRNDRMLSGLFAWAAKHVPLSTMPRHGPGLKPLSPFASVA